MFSLLLYRVNINKSGGLLMKTGLWFLAAEDLEEEEEETKAHGIEKRRWVNDHWVDYSKGLQTMNKSLQKDSINVYISEWHSMTIAPPSPQMNFSCTVKGPIPGSAATNRQ
jgi:hypothetical protein